MTMANVNNVQKEHFSMLLEDVKLLTLFAKLSILEMGLALLVILVIKFDNQLVWLQI